MDEKLALPEQPEQQKPEGQQKPEEPQETSGQLSGEPRQQKNSAGRPRRRRWFFGGMLTGILILFLAQVLIRGHLEIPFGRYGILNIRMPYYTAMHQGKNTLDTAEVDRKLEEVNYLINHSYLYDVDPQALSDGIFTGMIYGMMQDDRYAQYYSAKSFASETKRLNGSYEGIGVTVQEDPETGGLLVLSVNSLGPAREAGIEVDDVIIGADGVDLRTLELDEAVSEHVTGPAGTSVVLTVLRDGEEFDLTVGRATILDITVRGQMLGDTGTGYISITSFNLTTEGEFRKTWQELQSQGAESMVIDLRNNGGGDMNVCLRMLDFLLDDHLSVQSADGSEQDTFKNRTMLLSIEDKAGHTDKYYADDNAANALPLVIVVNGRSASASEIFTGVMMDYGYLSVGEQTYGKGIVQTLYTLSDQSAVKFTTAQYRLPAGELIHGTGITPSKVVPFEEFDDVTETKVNYAGGVETDLLQDVQISAALELLGSVPIS